MILTKWNRDNSVPARCGLINCILIKLRDVIIHTCLIFSGTLAGVELVLDYGVSNSILQKTMGYICSRTFLLDNGFWFAVIKDVCSCNYARLLDLFLWTFYTIRSLLARKSFVSNLYSQLWYSNGEFQADCPGDVWYHWSTNCLLYVCPPFRK